MINLDRRPDRWHRVSDRLARAKLQAKRVSATDARDRFISSAYESYLQENAAKARPSNVLSDNDVYRCGDHTHRVRSLEEHWGSPGVKSVGAFAYLHSWKHVLEDAVNDDLQSILVFDDDVVFHSQMQAIFNEALRTLPKDWAVLQLGTLRRRGLKKTKWWSSHLFMNEGRSVGSHAVGLSSSVFQELLELTSRFDAVFDDGALSTLTWRHRERSFVVFPELAIQDFADSDIQESPVDGAYERKKLVKRNGWVLQDYDF